MPSEITSILVSGREEQERVCQSDEICEGSVNQPLFILKVEVGHEPKMQAEKVFSSRSSGKEPSPTNSYFSSMRTTLDL